MSKRSCGGGWPATQWGNLIVGNTEETDHREDKNQREREDKNKSSTSEDKNGPIMCKAQCSKI
jgi:hypothetical protein